MIASLQLAVRFDRPYVIHLAVQGERGILDVAILEIETMHHTTKDESGRLDDLA